MLVRVGGPVRKRLLQRRRFCRAKKHGTVIAVKKMIPHSEVSPSYTRAHSRSKENRGGGSGGGDPGDGGDGDGGGGGG